MRLVWYRHVSNQITSLGKSGVAPLGSGSFFIIQTLFVHNEKQAKKFISYYGQIRSYWCSSVGIERLSDTQEVRWFEASHQYQNAGVAQW